MTSEADEAEQKQIEASGDEVSGPDSKWGRGFILVAAVLALALMAYKVSGPIVERLEADHATGAGEQKTISLPDGSSVILNGSSLLNVAFSADERRLDLVRGQALFTPAEDAARPFVVGARGGETRGSRGAFDLDLAPEETLVTVVEGMAAVSTSTHGLSPIEVQAGQRVHYKVFGAPSAPETIGLANALPWRSGKMVFDRTPLPRVVAELGRYHPDLFVIARPGLHSLRFTGTFDTHDPDAVLREMEIALPVRVLRFPYVTVLR